MVHARNPENITCLAGALEELNAIYRRYPDRRLKPDVSQLSTAAHQLLETAYGILDVPGATGDGQMYEDLLAEATEQEIAEDMRVRVLNRDTGQ